MELSAPLKVAHPPPRPMMIFDGDCGFCRRWVGRWKSSTGSAIDYEPSQAVGKDFPEIPRAAFDRAVQLVETDGAVRQGGAAALRAQAIAGRHTLPWWLYCRLPIFAAVVEILYRFVAAHRNELDKIDRWLLGSVPAWPSWRVGRWAFLRGMGVIYLIAFISFGMQTDGLIGSRGILPIAEQLSAIQQSLHHALWHDVPTLCWLNPSDSFLHALCLSGCIVSVLLIVNVLPLGAAVMAWVLYLSLVVAGQDFFSFQWDALLLEAGFLAIFYSPLEAWPRLGSGGEPPWITRWLMRWLLFRVVFLSGLVKLASHDPTWANFTALDYHYMTQPLPPWTAWYMAKLPEWFEHCSVFFVLAVELLCPIMVLGPRRYRRFGLFGIALLQVLILLTGNYGFFNLLTLALCLPLLEDDSRFWRWAPLGRKLIDRATASPAAESADDRPITWPSWILAPIALLLLFVSTVVGIRRCHVDLPLPAPLQAVVDYAAPYEIANSYGLFEIMTTDRPELILSGSDDGEHWREYQFKYKPGDPARRPRFCTPYLPRLDWQMWFLALDAEHTAAGSSWNATVLLRTMQRLRDGSPAVAGLFANDPFAGHSPKYVRAELYDYRFTTTDEKRATGDWWVRNDTGGTIATVEARKP